MAGEKLQLRLPDDQGNTRLSGYWWGSTAEPHSYSIFSVAGCTGRGVQWRFHWGKRP